MRRRSACWALILPLLAAGCPGGEGPRAGHGGGRGGAPAAPVAVGVEAAEKGTVRETLVAHAALEPEAHVEVPARATGEVVEVVAEANSPVSKGQVLLRLDRTRAELALSQARLAVNQSETSLARQKDLANKGLATKEELEQAHEALALAELTLQSAQLDLSDTELKSPFAGIVTERLVNVGDTLQAGAPAFRIADRDPLLAKARIPEAQAERVRIGQPALIRVDGLEKPLEGEVIRLAPLVDLESGTVVATVAVKDAEGVRIHRYATIEIVIDERAGAVMIPQDALALRGEEDRVLVCEPQEGGKGVVRQRDIVTGVRNGPRVEVRSGLEAGELVVVAAPDDLRDGTLVRLVDRGAPAAAPEVAAPASRPAKQPGKGAPGKADR